MKTHKAHHNITNPRHPITVHLVGAGGTGSQVAASLARINKSLIALGKPGLHVTLFDPDEITEANIGRQLFSEADLGFNKATVTITRLNRFYGSGWDSCPELYRIYSDYPKPNILITCVDTAKARLEIGDILKAVPDGSDSYDQGNYWLDFGNSQNTGQVILGTTYEAGGNSLETVIEKFDLTEIVEEDQGPSCSLAEALTKQDLFINSTLANLGCNLLWKLFTQGSLDHHGLYLNLQNMSVRGITV